MACGPDFEVEVRLWQVEISEEPAGHLRIVVLASVHERRRMPGLLKGAKDW
jgi:hypothetical protein